MGPLIETISNVCEIQLMDWNGLATSVLGGESISNEEALAVLQAPDDELLAILNAAYRIRKTHYGNRVLVNFLINAKSGLCPEDCHYCSQSAISSADIPKYRTLSAEQILTNARRGAELSASTCCIVLSGRGPSDKDVDSVCEAVRAIKSEMPGMKVCTCLGLLKDQDADKLAAAGSDRYNHNVNTSEAHYDKICSTHTFQDRIDTVERAQHAGMSACSGLIVGMKETEEDIISALRRLRELGADSIPINFLISIDGTPLEKHETELSPRQCLRILCLARFICPDQEIRISAGREGHLRSLQPLGLYPANSLFISDYLTTEGQAPQLDLALIEDMGFEVQSHETPYVETH